MQFAARQESGDQDDGQLGQSQDALTTTVLNDIVARFIDTNTTIGADLHGGETTDTTRKTRSVIASLAL